MPFVRPSLSALVTRIRADFRGRLGISGSLLRRAMADVLAAVWAGTAHLLHGHLEWLAKQLFAHLSEREFLLIQAAMYGITPTPATFASGTVAATGTDPTPIPIGTIFVRDDGVTYISTVATLMSGSAATVSVDAVNAGADANLAAGETLAFESPIAGIDSTVTVDAPGLTGGNDEESTEGTRARLLLRLREPPEGGADQDYEAWTLAVAGVTRAWIYRHESGLGTVTVRFARDDDASLFPDAGEVAEVQTALDTERPTTAEVTAAAPIDLPVAFTIAVVPDNATVQAAVEAELEDLFFREAEPGDGVVRGTVNISAIRTAIGVAEGVTDYTLTVPSANVVPLLGELATLGTVSWV